MKIDPRVLDTDTIYRILKGVVVPRPIGWISSVAGDGTANLAPFSFFTVVSRNPPIVSISILSKGDQNSKDTLRNILSTEAFVVHVVSLELVEKMHLTAVDHPPEVDEFEVVNLGKEPGELVSVPRVAGARVAMECVFDRVIRVGDVGDQVIFGKIVRFHIDDDVWRDRGGIDIAAMKPVGRLAVDYCTVDSRFGVPVPEHIRKSADDAPRG